MRRYAVYALAVILLGATVPRVSWFTPAQAINALMRDDSTVRSCMQQDAKGMRAGLTVQALSSSPRVALVQMQESCVCGAQNCPFWIYRADGGSAKLLVAGYGITIKTVARQSGPPDVVALAHDSALVSNGTRYAFQNGGYVAVDSWRLRADTNARKPAAIEIKFVAGTFSAHLSGNVSTGWNDVYIFAASAQQRLTISAATPRKGLDIALYREPYGTPPVNVDVGGKVVTLPVTGNYRLSVDPIGSDSGTVHYTFTVTIR